MQSGIGVNAEHISGEENTCAVLAGNAETSPPRNKEDNPQTDPSYGTPIIPPWDILNPVQVVLLEYPLGCRDDSKLLEVSLSEECEATVKLMEFRD